MKRFKTLFFSMALVVLSSTSYAQQPVHGWQHMSFDTDSVYGVEMNKAYSELLQGKKGKTVVVAVIDSGSDVKHEDLHNVLWVNEDEIPGNGIDDDNNGYVDDIHGWSFLGYEGGNVYAETLELTRLYAKYTKEFEGKDVKKLNRAEKKDYKKYLAIKTDYEKAKADADKSLNSFNKGINNVIRKYTLVSAYLDNPEFTNKDLEAVTTQDSIVKSSIEFFHHYTKRDDNLTGKVFYDNAIARRDKYESMLTDRVNYQYNTDWNPRENTSYDENDFSNFNYGNNTLLVEPEHNIHGTHCAGIIAAERDNNIGMNGIANNVKIMTVRAVPNGDEHDRDIAAAMRYAIDNGAQVISMSFGKSYSANKKGVDAAIAYGAKKGVLFVHAAGNDSKNVDVEHNYPDVKNSRTSRRNWIEVGASSWSTGEGLPASFSNYGKKTVDLFAPGVDIYSTFPLNKYKAISGTSMATPVVAGVAATIMSYYPNLSARQVKTILMSSVTNLKSLKVRKPGTKEIVKFGDLSVSGGVVNAYKALKLAEKMSK